MLVLLPAVTLTVVLVWFSKCEEGAGISFLTDVAATVVVVDALAGDEYWLAIAALAWTGIVLRLDGIICTLLLYSSSWLLSGSGNLKISGPLLEDGNGLDTWIIVMFVEEDSKEDLSVGGWSSRSFSTSNSVMLLLIVVISGVGSDMERERDVWGLKLIYYVIKLWSVFEDLIIKIN